MGLIQDLQAKGLDEIAQTVEELQRQTIILHFKDSEEAVPVGASKIGGYPDLPPDIDYPTMSGYTCRRGDKVERYEECAMQLVAQINLCDIAALDVENKLPHSGMLYFFWSGEIFPIHEKNKYYESVADNPGNAQFQKVIWYNGDLTGLKRTKPDFPYYTKYFTEAFEETAITFDAKTDYVNLEYELEDEEYEELCKIADISELEQYPLSGNKLFGFPAGGNAPEFRGMNLLFQYEYREGSLWGISWHITDDDLNMRNFANAALGADMD